MLDKQKIINQLQKDKLKLSKEFHISKMGLFGSFATNKQTPNSDIDFIIELDPNTKDIFKTKQDLRHYLKSQFHRSIDLAHYKYLKPYARKHILNEVEPIV